MSTKIFAFYTRGEQVLRDLPNNKFKDISDEDIILYAWTTSRKIKEKFISDRDMNKFVMKRLRIESSDIELFKKEYEDEQLLIESMRVSRNNPSKTGEVLLTSCESIRCTYEFNDIFIDMIHDLCSHNYQLIKQKYVESLDKVTYCTFHYMLYGDYGDVGDFLIDLFYNQGMSIEGYLDRGITENTLVMFIYLFKHLLK